MVNHAGKIIHDQIFLLRQVVPKATTVAMLVEPNRHDTEPERKDVQAAAQGRLVCNSSLSMSAATATSKAPSQRSCNAEPERCLWGSAHTWPRSGKVSSRWPVGMQFPQCIPCARKSWPVV
jgi:hypothetical protein